jgi:hypothetical protein
MAPITISKTTARRFVLGRQGLWPGRRWSDFALTHLENPGFAAALARGFMRFAEFLEAHNVNINVLEPAALRAQVRAHMT